MDPAIVDTIIGAVSVVFGAAVGAVITYILSQRRMSDKQIFQAWRIAFDSFVFKGPWRLQSDRRRAHQGIEDIIKAVNTGDISGSKERGKGRAFLRNQEWLAKMDDVEKRLNLIRDLARDFEKQHRITFGAEDGKSVEKITKEISESIDKERNKPTVR